MYEIKYRKPEEMKDSGVEWIGEIPRKWDLDRIQRFFNVRTEKVSDKDYEPLSVTKSGILKQLDHVAKTDHGENRKKVKKNDFVINSRADRKGSCGVSLYDGSVSLICHVLTPKGKINPKYINHLFRNYYFSEEFFRWGTGIVDDLWSTNIERMKKIIIPVPSEQQKIANFLDIKTSEFDSIISKKEKLIGKLEEAKKSLISEVVTGKVKIVDGELVKRQPEEMKDSGVEWLGMIPKEWEIGKLNFLARRITDGAHISPEVENGVYPFVSVRDLKNDSIDFQNCLLTSSRNYEYLFRNACNPKSQDVLISKDGTIGKTVVIDYNKKFVIASSLVIISPFNSIDSYYLNYALNSNFFQKQIMMYAKGAALPRISITHLKNCKLVFTRNYDEQQQVVMYLNQKVSKLINIGSKIELQIQKLKQAKQSLISEAVTGKIDLRDWEIIEEGEE